MRIITFLSLILIPINLISQTSQIDIDWIGNEQYNIGQNSVIVPKTKNFQNNYSYGEYFRIVKQWESDKIINESSVQITNLSYSNIDVEQFSGLDKINFKNEPEISFKSSVSKSKIFTFLEVNPIILIDGVYKKIESFDINYRFSDTPNNSSKSIQSSVMRNGNWYQFFI